MRVLNDFVCEDEHITEHFVDSETQEVRCTCGKPATKKLAAVTFKETTTGRNVSTKALVRWGKKRERQLKHERRRDTE